MLAGCEEQRELCALRHGGCTPQQLVAVRRQEAHAADRPAATFVLQAASHGPPWRRTHGMDIAVPHILARLDLGVGLFDFNKKCNPDLFLRKLDFRFGFVWGDEEYIFSNGCF